MKAAEVTEFRAVSPVSLSNVTNGFLPFELKTTSIGTASGSPNLLGTLVFINNIYNNLNDDGLSKKNAGKSEYVEIDKSKSLSKKGDMGETSNEQESKEIETLEKSEEIVEGEKTENIKE